MTANQLAILSYYRACYFCKEKTRFPVRDTARGLFCSLHPDCESCKEPVISTADVVVCDTPACYSSGHDKCLRVYVTKDAPDCLACQACKNFWQLRVLGRICGVCHQPFCSAHFKKCIACPNIFYQSSNANCATAQLHINGACSAWCLDAAIARLEYEAERRYELTYAAQAFLPRYTAMAFALAQFNWPVLITMAVLDLCVPPILFVKTSAHQRWEVLKAINRAWRVKNDCAVHGNADQLTPQKKMRPNWLSGVEQI